MTRVERKTRQSRDRITGLPVFESYKVEVPIEKNSAWEYIHTGLDEHGREVGADDLMGIGTHMRPFYFDKWKNEIKREFPDCDWKIEWYCLHPAC